MEVHVYLHHSPESAECSARIERKLDAALQLLSRIQTKEDHMTDVLDTLEQDVTDTEGVEASAVALLTTIHTELTNALAGGLTAATIARVQAIATKIEADKATLAAAVAANPDPAAGP